MLNEPDPPPTLQELADRARGQNPFACRRCGCQHWNVVNTYRAGRGGETRIQRQRTCRHCGQEGITTSEVVVPQGQRAIVVAKSDERGPGPGARDQYDENGEGAQGPGVGGQYDESGERGQGAGVGGQYDENGEGAQGPGVGGQYDEDDEREPDPAPPGPAIPPAAGDANGANHKKRRRKR